MRTGKVNICASQGAGAWVIPMDRSNIAIVTGGETLEARSSLASAQNVYRQLDAARFNRVLVSVRNWRWRVLQADGLSTQEVEQAAIDLSDFSLVLPGKSIHFDAAFIALHGAPAETGHLQAYFELAGLPYTGSDILTSATAMNKSACKRLIRADSAALVPREWHIPIAQVAAFDPAKLGVSYPCIVKPNAYGSGAGVRLAGTPRALEDCVRRAAELGQDVLVEEYISGREFTVGAVILNGELRVLPVAEVFRPDQREVLAARGSIGFTERQSAQLSLTPDLDDQAMAHITDATRAVGKALGCRSFYRADFILGDDGGLYFLEVNTIPGMTERSVFTAQVLAGGLVEGDLYRAVLEDVMAEGARAL